MFKINLFLQSQVFATPETLIGFHPDAGASFYLSHLPGHLGMLAVHYSFSCAISILFITDILASNMFY